MITFSPQKYIEMSPQAIVYFLLTDCSKDKKMWSLRRSGRLTQVNYSELRFWCFSRVVF